jgi:hypothetical protein
LFPKLTQKEKIRRREKHPTNIQVLVALDELLSWWIHRIIWVE